MDAVVTQVITDVADAVLAVAVPIGVAYLWKLTGLKENDTAQTAISLALERGAGEALGHGIAVGDALLTKAATRSVALQKAEDYVNTAVPDALTTLGVTPDQVARKVANVVDTKLHAALAVSTPAAVVAPAG